MSDCDCKIEIENAGQRKVLITLLCINAVMFVVEIVAGTMSESTALIADSLDMFADATVYAIALYAVGRSMVMKTRAALLSGVFQIMLGISVLTDIIRRLVVGSEPESLYMLVVGFIALLANVICLKLIAKHREGEVHMRASWIFSKNDVIANLATILGGVLVAITQTAYPDLIIGCLITVIIIRGGIHIIQDAKQTDSTLR